MSSARVRARLDPVKTILTTCGRLRNRICPDSGVTMASHKFRWGKHLNLGNQTDAPDRAIGTAHRDPCGPLAKRGLALEGASHAKAEEMTRLLEPSSQRNSIKFVTGQANRMAACETFSPNWGKRSKE